MVDKTRSSTPIGNPSESAIQATDTSAIAAIVLAGGMSQRMGNINKLLLNYDGASFLQQAVTPLVEAGVEEIVVVLGHESEHIRAQLASLPSSITTKLQLVVNPDYKQGQMTSVSCGLAALSGSKDGVLICLGDQPLIRAAHIQQLISAFVSRVKGKQIIVPVYQHQRGNPVLISDWVREQVLIGNSGAGCRHFIDSNPALVIKLSVDDAAFIADIDTPEEYAALNEKK